MIAMDLTNLGEALHLGGSLDEAELLLREAFSLFEALGDPAGTGSVLHQLGRLALDRGNGEEARTLLVESLRLRWPAGERGAAIDTLEALAEVTWHLGDLDFAAALLQAAIIARTETGFARQPVYEDRFRHVLDAVCDRAARIGPRDLEETVAKAMGQSALRASFTI
jgi:tetratricopeptide (TPR) repeat protein